MSQLFRPLPFRWLVLYLLAGVLTVQARADEDGLFFPDLPRPPPDLATDQVDAIEVSDARATMYEAMIEVQDGLYAEAIPKLEWVIATDPTLLGAWETLGWSYWLTDRPDDAKALWGQLVTIAPGEPMGYNLLALVMTRDGDFERSAALYESSLGLDPDQYDVRLNYARVLLWGGRHGEAVEQLQRLHREDPDRVDVEIELAWSLYATEDYEAAIDHWNHVNEVIPDHPQFMMARVNVLVLIGALQEAGVEALRVLELEPGNVNALNTLASLAMQTRRPKEAVAALRRLYDHTEDDKARAQIAMGLAGYMKSLLDLGNADFTVQEILDWVDRSLSLDDQQVNTHLFQGEMLVLSRRYNAAEDVFRFVLDEFNPYNHRALYGLIETYFGREMYDEVERQLRENLRLFNSNNPLRHQYWARYYFARGRFDDAMESLDRLEYEGAQGAVFSLLYHGINPSEYSDMPSVRQLREQLMALRRDGYRFIAPSDIEAYFERKQGADLVDRRPWLNRLLESGRYAWTGERRVQVPRLADYTPEKVAMVTFDGGLRNSFRYGTQVGEELAIPMTMFVGVGDVLDRTQRYVASFTEIREYQQSGVWEIQSHLWDAGQLFPLTEDGERTGLPLPNLLWLPGKGRQETLREYHARLRREFRDSRRVLARELGVRPESIAAVAYPYGEVGQVLDSNIDLFHVPDVVLNEGDITYAMGFVVSPNGYAMKTDDVMLWRRWEPGRQATGRDVLRAAYRQHPVFIARRMRAEMAALHGELHMAVRNEELLKRDGYPEEDQAEVNEYIRRHLGRLAGLPAGQEDLDGRPEERRGLISLRSPYIGIAGTLNRGNEVIDDREGYVFAGLNLNRRLGLQVHAGAGRIKQTLLTNRFVEVEETTVSRDLYTEQRVVDGEVTNERVDRTTISTRTVESNTVVRTRYEADKVFAGGALRYTHEGGSMTMADVRLYVLDGPDIGEDEPAWVFGIEHHWRPILAMDLAARYQHGLVPSAREVIAFDSLSLRPFWRVRDDWHANGLAHFAYYDDQNSYVKASLENFWRLSMRQDVWVGLHHALDTVDRDSDLYWSPYWEQRHFASLRIRRRFPNYFGMVRVNYGFIKSDVRREEKDRFENAKARGELQGWSPGSGPDEGWRKLLGFSATVSRSFQNGFEVAADVDVNTTGEYTEHTLGGRLMYKF